MTLTSAYGAVGTVLGFIVLIGIGWLVWKRALLDIQQKAMDVQEQALKAYITRVEQLEETVKEQGATIAELRGIIEGKDASMRDIVCAIADANICLETACQHRIIPTV